MRVPLTIVTSSTGPSSSTATASASSTSPTSRRRRWGDAHLRARSASAAAGAGRRARRARHRRRRAGRDRLATTAPGCSTVVLRRAAASAGSSCRSTSGSTPTRSRYIVEHSGASVLLVDPELDERARRRRRAKHRFVLGAEADDELLPLRRRAASRGQPDEDATAHDQLHERHDRPAQGRAAHPPQPLDQRGDVRLARRASATATSTCTRCRCSTATAGACRTRSPAWACRTSCCARSTAPRSCAASSEHGVTLHVRRAGGRRRGPRRRRRRGTGEIPGPRPGADRRRRRAAADADDRAGRDGARLGVHPDLRPHRDLAAAHDQPRAAPSGTTSTPASGRASSAAPARRRSACALRDRRRRARCWPAATSCSRATGSSPRRPPRRSTTAGSTPATAASIDDERLPHDLRPQEGRDHHRRRERLVDRGRGRALLAPGGRRGRGDRRARREVGRDGQGARRARAGRDARPRPS